jgi:hypothetical protein
MLYFLFIKYFTASTCELFVRVQLVNITKAAADGRVVLDVGLQLLDRWDRGFEACSGHGCSYLVFVCR